MLNELQSDDPDVWVEVRVDDGNVDAPPRYVVVYVGRVRRQLLQDWTRIEHGEYWFMLNDVLWWEEDAAPAAEPTSWTSRMLGRASASNDDSEESPPTPEHRTLIRQSEKAAYWGYGDQLFLRLDRVYRITPLSPEYVEKVVLPALQRDDVEPT